MTAQTATFTVGTSVIVTHEAGVEVGVVAGVQNDPYNGTFYRVRFADGTYSTWTARRVAAV